MHVATYLNACCSPSSSASTTQSSVPSVATITTDCPGSNGTVYTSLFANGANGIPSPEAGLEFTKLCSVGQGGNNLAQAFFTTFDECIELCASLNFWNQNRNCAGMTYKLA